jgi:hypothetical protein
MPSREAFGSVIAEGGSGVVIRIAPPVAAASRWRLSEDDRRPDEVGNVGTRLMGPDGAFIAGCDFLMDDGVTAAYWYVDLDPTSRCAECKSDPR